MNCPVRNTESTELLLDYCARTLPAGVEAELERHIDICPACQEFIVLQQRAWNALDEFEPAPISAGFDSRLYARIDAAEKPPSKWRQWFGWKPALSMAAACASLAVLFVINTPQPQPPTATVDISADQVEQALDDLEMLKQLSPSQDL